MNAKLFLDSDVVIDFFTDREPFISAASQLFELNEKKEITIFLSAVSINNIYYIVRKHLGHAKALEVVEELIDMTEIVGTTKNEIKQALANEFSDFEDSIQYTSALAIKGLTAIITRNVKDYKNAKIAVLTPSMFLEMREKERN
jgi:predicted nucleic acid-binding protein